MSPQISNIQKLSYGPERNFGYSKMARTFGKKRAKQYACLSQVQTEQPGDSTDVQNPLHFPDNITYQTEV